MVWRPGLSAAAREHSHALAHSLRHQPAWTPAEQAQKPPTPDAAGRRRLPRRGAGCRGCQVPRKACLLPGVPGCRVLDTLLSFLRAGPRTSHGVLGHGTTCSRPPDGVQGPDRRSPEGCASPGGCPTPALWVCPVPGANSVVGGRCPVEGVRCRPCGFARCQLGRRGPVAGCPVPTLWVCPVPGARCQLGRRGPVPSGRVPVPSGGARCRPALCWTDVRVCAGSACTGAVPGWRVRLSVGLVRARRGMGWGRTRGEGFRREPLRG